MQSLTACAFTEVRHTGFPELPKMEFSRNPRSWYEAPITIFENLEHSLSRLCSQNRCTCKPPARVCVIIKDHFEQTRLEYFERPDFRDVRRVFLRVLRTGTGTWVWAPIPRTNSGKLYVTRCMQRTKSGEYITSVGVLAHSIPLESEPHPVPSHRYSRIMRISGLALVASALPASLALPTTHTSAFVVTDNEYSPDPHTWLVSRWL